MTYTGCLIILAIVCCSVSFIFAIKRHKKIKDSFPNSHAEIAAKLDIFLKPFSALGIVVCVWGLSMILLILIGSKTPIEIESRSAINTNNQIVVFEEQRGTNCKVSVDGKQYVCARIVISKDITHAQIVFVERKTADNFYAKFFFDEMTGLVNFYELHIPAEYLNPS